MCQSSHSKQQQNQGFIYKGSYRTELFNYRCNMRGALGNEDLLHYNISINEIDVILNPTYIVHDSH